MNIRRFMLVLALASSVASAAERGPEAVDLCGAGRIVVPVATDAVDASALKAVLLPPLLKTFNDSRAHADIAARLRRSPRETAHATALIMEIVGLDRPLTADAALQESTAAPAREALATLAKSTSDPTVYAMAFEACRGATDGACAQIDAARWAQLDPGNAGPLIAGLDAATLSTDDLLHRIGASSRSSIAWTATVGEVLRVAPDDDASLLEVDRVVTGLIGVEAAVGLPAYQRVVNACKGDALRDTNRAQSCEAVATLLTQRSDMLIDMSIGTAIGNNLGWPDERVGRLRHGYEAYTFGLQDVSADGRFDCAAIRGRLQVMRTVAMLGEVGAMREWLARSGKSDDDLKRENEARRAGFARAEAAAAAAEADAASSPR